MTDLPAGPDERRRLLQLRRRDRAAARQAMAELPESEQLAVVCNAPVNRRAELIDLAPHPERLVPAMPPAELVFTIKAVGLESATWLLELATPEQVVTAIDLDAWRGHLPERDRRDAWLAAVAEIEDDALARDLDALDDEILVDWLGHRVFVVQKPDDDEGWQPPDRSQTLEGQFHFVALREDDDLAPIVRCLRLLFERDYWTYFRLMQGTIHELPTENEEWALRWRNARLQDLGFPPWDEAMGVYRHVAPDARSRIDADASPLDVDEWRMPVWIPQLPAGRESEHLVFRTIAELEPEERRSAFYAFVAVANKITVADGMDLSDAETISVAIEKAAVWMSRGLEWIADEHALGPVEVVRRVALERLFTVGANLDPEASGPPRAG